MGLIEFHVEDISAEAVPKLVLFDRSDRDESATTGASCSASPARVAGVALLATAVAVGVWLAAKRLRGLELSC
jgi:hypothetical protein